MLKLTTISSCNVKCKKVEINWAYYWMGPPIVHLSLISRRLRSLQ